MPRGDAARAAQVDWPLSMVLDRSAQNLYQALLRHLLGLAVVERELHTIWRTYQCTRALFRRAPLASSAPPGCQMLGSSLCVAQLSA